MIKNGQTRMISVKNSDTIGKIVDMIPDIVDKFTAKKEEMVSDEEAVNAGILEVSKKFWGTLNHCEY